MNKILKAKLEKTIEICEAILDGREFDIQNNEIDLIPGYLEPTTVTQAKKDGLILKQRQTPIGTWNVYLSSGGGWKQGKIYTAASFKSGVEG